MRRTRRAGRPALAGGISLFPFLAVLICVMGSLIVLLVVLARHARVQAAQAAAAAAAEQSASLEEIEQDRALLQWQAEQIQESRAKTEADLAEARLALGAVEDHVRSLQRELERLKAAWDELERAAAGGAAGRAEAEAELARLRAEIAEAEKRLAEETAAAQKRRNSYAVVPYQGPHGTHRRPVYVECRRDEVVLQPEGTVLRPADFEGALGEGNALAAAVRATREYWAAGRGAPAGEADEPYPLLLVRPDGIEAYYAARDALRSWGPDFGYELIGQNWDLKFPPPDAELARILAREVQAARARQELLAEIAPRYAGGRRPTYRAGARGIVREDGPGGAGAPVRPRAPTFGSAEGPGEGDAADGGSGPALLPGAGREGQGGAEERVFGSQFGDEAAGGTRPARPSSAAQGPDGSLAGRGTGAAGRPGGALGRPGEPGPVLRPGEWHEKPPEPPPDSKLDATADARDESGRRARANLAKVRGRDWGLPNATSGSIPITRPIPVECHPDRLLIAPGAAQGREVRLGARTGDSVDEFVSGVWDHMDAWGIAGRGMYWRPVLSVRVAPGAEQRFHELQSLLEGSGLRVERTQ